MVNHWKLDKRIDKTVLFLQKYYWDEKGLNIEYLDELSTIRINITFPTRVEMFCFKFVEQSVFLAKMILINSSQPQSAMAL